MEIAQWVDRLHVIQVVSRDNATDCHSRRDNWDEYWVRLARMSLAVKHSVSGQRVGERVVMEVDRREDLRHAPPGECPLTPEDVDDVMGDMIDEFDDWERGPDFRV